jgi:hypothetical protein
MATAMAINHTIGAMANNHFNKLRADIKFNHQLAVQALTI